MKKILCFGDSNTYGYNPFNSSRYSSNIRWTGILKTLLADRFIVIEEGCNNRTCFQTNPAGFNYTGTKILPEIIAKGYYDYVIIQIGINDVQKIYDTTLEDIENGISHILKIAQNSTIILLSPPIIRKNVLKHSYFSSLFNEISIKKSYLMQNLYRSAAKKNNCMYLDVNSVIQTSTIDGIHYEETEHNIIAKSVYDIIISAESN